MDTDRITRLAATIDKLRNSKFYAKDKEIKVEGFSYLSVDEAEAIAAELNKAIKPILLRAEAELRKELKSCAA